MRFVGLKELAVDDDVKSRFDEVNKRIEATEKRFDDVKWYLGGVTTLFTIGFSVLTLVLSWNYSYEKTSLREFQRDLKEELGKVDALPKIDLLGVNRAPLANQDVIAAFKEKENGDLQLVIRHVLRNSGTGLSGPMFVKVYSSDPVVLFSMSSDEPHFKYEAAITPRNLDPNEIPGKYTTNSVLNLNLPLNSKPPPGKYDALLKVFYGKGKFIKFTQAPFTILIP